MSSLAPLEQQKTGKKGATPPILRRKDPTYPCTQPEGDMCHPSTIPTHRNTEAYAKPPAATHTLTRVHAQWRLGRVHILNALGAAGGCCRAHARHRHHQRNNTKRGEKTQSFRPTSAEETHPILPPDAVPSSRPSPGTVHRNTGKAPQRRKW